MAEQKRELQMNEEKLLIAQAEDLIHRCCIQDIPVCSGFLDARQQSLLRRQFGTKHGDVTIVYYGGYEDADRVVMACLPFYLSEFSDLSGSAASDDHGSPAGRMTYFDDVLTVIRAHVPERSAAGRSGRSLAHSDYLGALMGLGIDRSVIGDILVRDDGADIIVRRDMADYLLQNLTSAGKAHISPEELPLAELRVPDKCVTLFSDTVASMRLDAVLSSAFRISRGKAAGAIRQSLVFVDHLQATRPDMNVREGAELVIRHMGKVRLAEIGKRTRKDRIRITFEKYDNNK